MIQDPVRRSRVKRTLLIVILSTIPCYLLGAIVLLANGGVRERVTPTATSAISVPLSPEPATLTPSPTLPIPTAVFPTRTSSFTPTISRTPTLTRTYVVPTSTPSLTPTPTETLLPPPTDTPTLENTLIPTQPEITPIP